MLRVIIVLFVGITVVSVVLKAFQASVIPNAVQAEVVAQEPAFLPPPPADSKALTNLNESSLGDIVSPVATLQPAWNLLDSPDLAGSLLHDAPERFLLTLEQDFPDPDSKRRRVLESFSVAMAGRTEEAAMILGSLSPGEGSSAEEYALLQTAVSGGRRANGIASSTTSRPGSVQNAMELALLAREGQSLLQERKWQAAAEALSTLLSEDLGSPWTSDPGFIQTWATMLNKAQSNYRWHPSGAWNAIEFEVQAGDNLSLIRSRAVDVVEGLRVCTGLISTVNGIGDRYLHAGEVLRVPTDPVSCLVDLEARHVFYFFGEEIAYVWPVAIGAAESETPTGSFVVGDLIHKPAWFRPGMPMIPYGDPKNELGTHWIGWNRTSGESTHYGFHGTWEPDAVGNAVSDGCVRLRNEDVEHLYRILPRGSSIRVQS